MLLFALFSAVAVFGFLGVANAHETKWTPYPDLVSIAVVSCLAWTLFLLPKKLKHIPIIGLVIMLVNHQNSPGLNQLPFIGFGAGVLITIISFMPALKKMRLSN